MKQLTDIKKISDKLNNQILLYTQTPNEVDLKQIHKTMERYITCLLKVAPITKFAVAKFTNDYEDLFQLAFIGILRALSKYKPSYKVRFTTYAQFFIVDEVSRFIEKETRKGVVYCPYNKVNELTFLSLSNDDNAEYDAKEIKLDKVLYSEELEDILTRLDISLFFRFLAQKANGKKTLQDHLIVEMTFNDFSIRDICNKLNVPEKKVNDIVSVCNRYAKIRRVSPKRVINMIIVDLTLQRVPQSLIKEMLLF